MWLHRPKLIINCAIIAINQVEKGSEPSPLLDSSCPFPLYFLNLI